MYCFAYTVNNGFTELTSFACAHEADAWLAAIRTDRAFKLIKGWIS